MPIGLTCSCGKQLLVADEFAGRQGRCPACGSLLEIPQRDVAVSVVEPSPLPAAQAVTVASGWREPMESGSTEYAVAPLAHEQAERLLEVPEVSRPEYKLFSPSAIGVVAFLAGPVGAFILLFLNYWRLGKRGAAWITLALALVTTAVMIAISVALPASVPSFLMGLPVFVVLWSAAHRLQGNAYDAHRRKGGESASGWTATGIAVLGIVLYFGAVVGVFLMYDPDFNGGLGPKIDFGGEEVYYTKGGTEAEARALGAFLREAGFFDGHGSKSVRVSLDGQRLVISFIVQDWVVHDAQMQQEFRTLGQQASQRAFAGRPVVVELCDAYFNVKKRL